MDNEDIAYILVIKTLRELTNCGLKEGKDMVDLCRDGRRPLIKRNIGKYEAEKIEKKLREVGASAVFIDEDGHHHDRV
jgi:ribosomal protein L7/L12